MMSRLSRFFSASNVVMEQKNEIGIDPAASTAFLAGERLKGYPGYGEAGSRAQVYYELACNSAHMLSRNVLSLCHELSPNLLERSQIEQKVKMFHMALFLSSVTCHQALRSTLVSGTP